MHTLWWENLEMLVCMNDNAINICYKLRKKLNTYERHYIRMWVKKKFETYEVSYTYISELNNTYELNRVEHLALVKTNQMLLVW